MFIELTDHLRCPADHPESYLVLIPDAMQGRRVLSGILGCPECHAEYRITDAILDFTPAAESPSRDRGPHGSTLARPGPEGIHQGRAATEGPLGAHWRDWGPRESIRANPAIDSNAILALLGLDGPGGYLGLVGNAVRFATGLSAGLPGAHLVAINPPTGTQPSAELSIVHSPRIPVKARSLRGVVVGLPIAAEPDWQTAAIRAVLPGLRATGEGPIPVLEGFELLGAADGWWVGRAP